MAILTFILLIFSIIKLIGVVTYQLHNEEFERDNAENFAITAIIIDSLLGLFVSAMILIS